MHYLYAVYFVISLSSAVEMKERPNNQSDKRSDLRFHFYEKKKNLRDSFPRNGITINLSEQHYLG